VRIAAGSKTSNLRQARTSPTAPSEADHSDRSREPPPGETEKRRAPRAPALQQGAEEVGLLAERKFCRPVRRHQGGPSCDEGLSWCSEHQPNQPKE
jgi:hypothetical protein